MPKSINKILYIMHVSWGWIKQRPHFIAEELAKSYKLTVFTVNDNKTNVVDIPKSRNIKIKSNIELNLHISKKLSYLVNFFIKKIRFNYNYLRSSHIWITHPSQFIYFRKKNFKNRKLVYDCMDDHIEMYHEPVIKEKLTIIEKKLCDKSDVIICSSDYLKMKLINRHSKNYNIKIINNAITKESLNYQTHTLPENIKSQFTLPGKNIIYIGTISDWFDFNIITENLKNNQSINYFLVGPVDTVVPKHKRIITIPPVEHKYVFEIMKYADCLIMPFKVNELIKSVNPVKAYEYIYSNKPVIIVEYGETQKFKKYVHLYKNQEDFNRLIELVVEEKLQKNVSKSDIQTYISQNTWESRVQDVVEHIK